MLYVKTLSSCVPAPVTIENLPDGRHVVRMADHVAERADDDGAVYEYDEVVFELPEDREETVQSVTANFAAWWEFGQQPVEEITLEQRVSDLEDLLLGMMEG